MESPRVRRKLTTILSADVAGYSRLMGDDEEATLRALGERRRIIDRLIGAHGGRIFATAGDSVVAEFASTVEAVRCAAEVQDALAAADAETGVPEDRRMRFRIGINVGDVMVEGDNLLGDGVNLAARLEGLAHPGTILVSGNVFEQVEGKLPYHYGDLGERRLKNIAKPVRVYRVKTAAGATSAPPAAPTRRRRQQQRRIVAAALGALIAAAVLGVILRGGAPPETTATPALALMPFRAIGGVHLDGFSEGLTEDLITVLTEKTGLRVLSGAAALAAEGSRDAQRIGRRLKARYVLDGSVRQAGKVMRITAQLVDAETGTHLWGGRYDRPRGDILAVQEEVAGRIVVTLSEKLADAERERAAAGEIAVTGSLLGGLAYVGRVAQQAVSTALTLWERTAGAMGMMGDDRNM